jgi:DNA-binding response OmpR family regulator
MRMDLYSNHSAGQTSHALQIVFSCHDISCYQNFMSGLAKQFIVTICQDFDQLLEILQYGKPDLVLVEVPQNKSTFLSSLINLLQKFPDLRIILVSDQLHQHELIAAFNIGTKDYFPDPVDELLLLERVNSIAKNIH